MPKLPPELDNDYWSFIMAPYRDWIPGKKHYLLKSSVAQMLNRYDWS